LLIVNASHMMPDCNTTAHFPIPHFICRILHLTFIITHSPHKLHLTDMAAYRQYVVGELYVLGGFPPLLGLGIGIAL
jgi:hypothetical protein